MGNVPANRVGKTTQGMEQSEARHRPHSPAGGAQLSAKSSMASRGHRLPARLSTGQACGNRQEKDSVALFPRPSPRPASTAGQCLV